MSEQGQRPKGLIGIRKPSAEVATVAAPVAPATAVLLYQRTDTGQNPRTVILRKVIAYSNVGNAVLEIGQGGLLAAPVFARIIPPLLVVNMVDNEWLEEEIPEVRVGADLTVECDLDGVLVQVEVEEIGS